MATRSNYLQECLDCAKVERKQILLAERTYSNCLMDTPAAKYFMYGGVRKVKLIADANVCVEYDISFEKNVYARKYSLDSLSGYYWEPIAKDKNGNVVLCTYTEGVGQVKKRYDVDTLFVHSEPVDNFDENMTEESNELYKLVLF